MQVTHFTLFSVMHRPAPLLTKPGFADPLAAAGISLARWGSGTVADATATPGVRVRSLWVFRGGVAVGYIAGAPDFVNSAFIEMFPGGVIPEGTFLAVVTGDLPPPRLRLLQPHEPAARDDCSHSLQRFEVARGIAFDHQEVRALSGGDGASVGQVQEPCARARCEAEHLDRGLSSHRLHRAEGA